ncbi:MAG: hypothetical protein ACPG61_16690 [Paracoccaceae bacterium]
MITKNYQALTAGKLVASGPGTATLTANSVAQWAVGDSSSAAPTLVTRHAAPFAENVSMQLDTGEHLWVFGAEVVAVTAENPAAGDI